MVHLVSWDLEECKVSRETWEKLVRWASKVCLEFLGQSGPWVNKVHSVQKVNLDQSVFVASKEKLVLQACVVHLEPLVLLVPLVFVGRQAHLESKEKWDPLVSRVILVLKVSRVTQVQSVQRDPLEQLVPLEQTERMVSLVPSEQEVTEVHKVFAVSQDLLVLKA